MDPLSMAVAALTLAKAAGGLVKKLFRRGGGQTQTPPAPAATGTGNTVGGRDATSITGGSGVVVQAEPGAHVSVTVGQPAEPPAAQTASTDLPNITAWVGRPGTLDEAFVGRENELEAMRQALERRRAVLLSGGTGTGKTRLAAEYSHRSGARGFWTSAGETVPQTVAALAPHLGVPVEGRTDEEVSGEVQRRLPDLPTGTLWVIDNLGDLGQVNGLCEAAGNLRLLATSRDGRGNSCRPTLSF